MTGKERRIRIIKLLTDCNEPIAGKKLAGIFGVSRQVIVQDMALLRAEDHEIIATTQGYVLKNTPKISRVFKVEHTDDEVEAELQLILDYGGEIEDVFVYHKIYGVVRADLNIKSRQDILNFLANIRSGKSTLLKNITSSYHYHTVTAPTEIILDLIQDQLGKHGFLAKLQDYEPIDFWGQEDAKKDAKKDSQGKA